MKNLTKADYEDDVKFALKEAPSISLIKGSVSLILGVGLFFVVLMIVVMTPDPNHEINYPIFLMIEVMLSGVIFYGGYTLGKLGKFLELCERKTLCYQKNSREEKTSQCGLSSTQRPQQEK